MNVLRAARALWARLIATLMPSSARRAADDELREELESHLEMQIADNIRRGMTPDEARRAALLDAGGMTAAAEAVRQQRGLPVIEDLVRDLRHTARGLLARPGYAIAVVLTLALAIGANTSMFSVVDAVILHPLPYPDADRVLSISQAKDGDDQGVVADRAYAAWESSTTTIDIAAYRPTSAALATRAGTERIQGREVRPAYFRVIGLKPVAGRVLTSDDYRSSAPPVAVISERLWRERFGGDPGVVGRTMILDEHTLSIVGVMPDAATTKAGAQYWTPFRFEPTEPGATYFWFAIARLHEHATLVQARAELRALTPRIAGWRPFGSARVTPVVMTLADSRFGDRRKPLLLLFGAVGVLLLIACANVANLALVRVAGRQREFAVRLALGANRWRLARALLLESLMLAAAGAALGLLLSIGAVKYFVHLNAASIGNPDGIRVNGLVLLFTVAIAVASALAFGLAPILMTGRGDVSRALSNGTPRASIGGGQQRVRRLLVVGQLATALMLLTGTGLVARSFWRVTSPDNLGFQPGQLGSVAPRLPENRYDGDRAANFYENLLTRARRLPAVRDAALASVPPLSGISGSYSTRDSAGNTRPEIDMADVGPGYFRTTGTHLIAGREFTDADGPRAPRVVIIDDILARRLFPAGNALGNTMPGPGGKSTVIGIVSSVRPTIDGQPTGLLYASLAQQGIGGPTVLLVRSRGAFEATQRALTALVRSMDATLPAPKVQRLDDVVSEAVAPRTFVLVLLALFAGVAALLAVIGLYGVLSRIVTERTREIGIRVALGAAPRGIIRVVLGQGALLAVIGVALGLAGSAATVHVMGSLVYDTSVYDPWAFGVGAALLVMVCLVASYLPARRATRIDPVEALRQE